MKKFFLSSLSRIIRLALALLLIYASMVFYLMLSERRIAFPRAIKHEEARKEIADTNKIQKVFCTTSDEILLEGFFTKIPNIPTLLYFPDADEDAAQFMAETMDSKNINRLTFNYRGSGENKGKPEEETFLADAKQIANCAQKISSQLLYSGRGVGAIAAAKLRNPNAPLILIDPVESISEKISSKYKLFFPKFLIHTKVSLAPEDLNSKAPTLILEDRSINQVSNENFKKKFPNIPTRGRDGKTLAEILDQIIIPEKQKEVKADSTL